MATSTRERAVTLLERARNALRGVRPRGETEGQRVTAQETGVMLGLMGEAQSAGAAMTDEQRLLLIQAMPGMRAREAVLLGIPNRSIIEENELHMIRREMAALEQRDAPPTLEARTDGGWRPQRFLGPLAASPIMAALLSPWTWLALMAGFALIQMGLKERIENQRDEARALAHQQAEAALEWRERSEEYRLGLIDAANVARQAAGALEAERAANERRQARERRRVRELQGVLTNSPEPPAWELRGDEPAETGEQPGA